MYVSSAPLDIDLASPVTGEGAVEIPFARARVLVRWSGVPLGIVEVSVRDGHVCRSDVLQALRAQWPHAFAREAVRRSLLLTGVAPTFNLDAVWNRAENQNTSVSRVSVVVCTRDRPADLAPCLAALQRLSPAPAEVLIVDNAPSSDAALKLVQSLYPTFRYICEPRPGLDHARNRAVAEATGDIIAFTDDDVVVDVGWVGALAHAFASDPAIGLVTGLAEPLEQKTAAQIIFERYGGFGRGCRRTYSQSTPDRPMPWTLIGAGQLGAGANMALRREVFEQVGLFDPALDVGTATLGGGDHDLFFRVLRAGYLCVYEPAAVVRHRHRRSVAELRHLLYCYGHATRCFFEREELNFPSDRKAIRRLRRWWWKEWAWKRAWRAMFRPALVPRHLVFAEIKGFIRASRAYARARERLVPDERNRPDRPRPRAKARPQLRNGVGVLLVEVSTPLVALVDAAAYASVEILVQWRGQPIGTVRIANHGHPLSARRLADEIAHALWHRLLKPTTRDESAAFVKLNAACQRRVSEGVRPSIGAAPREATIVVTTCHRPNELRRCLESLSATRTTRPLQIVVVDNRPSLGSAAPVVREFPGVELVLEHRAGSSNARNAGIAAARGELIAMVDDDMRVSPDWLEQLLAPFARADVMAVTGNTLPARLETDAERLLEVYGGFGRGFYARDYDSAWFHRRRWRAVPTWQIGGSGNAAFRASVFCDIAQFDRTLGAGVPTGVGEDTKLFYDILHAGFTIAYQPAATAWHYHRVTMQGLRRQLYAYSKGHVAYHLRTFFDHGDGRAWVRLLAELPLAFCVRARDRLLGRYAYPWNLLFVEFAGTLAGSWSLWRAHRLMRKIAHDHATNQKAPERQSTPRPPASLLEVQP